MNKSGIYINFYINSTNPLSVSFQASLFKYTIRIFISFSNWDFYIKSKPWAFMTQIGPFFFRFLNEDKFLEHVDKILQQNEINNHLE